MWRQLLDELRQVRLLEFARADLVVAMDPRWSRRASRGPAGATYHFLQVARLALAAIAATPLVGISGHARGPRARPGVDDRGVQPGSALLLGPRARDREAPWW